MPHTHPCWFCKAPVACDGELHRNFDGWPETVCRIYHVELTAVVCEPCAVVQAERAAADLLENV